MAEVQKNVEAPVEAKPETTTAPVVEPLPVVEPVVDPKPVVEEPKPTEAAPIAEDKPAEEVKPAEETKEEPKEEAKEEVKPIEEGFLGHKAQGLSFPKNLIASKEFFFFGVDAVEAKVLAAYRKAEKSAETANTNTAWASQTGKGLLFVGDKKAPTSVISLADATEPETDGTHKFHLTSKGNKHTFKAANTAERDNWVAQLKLKIAEAKELAASVTESEAYKTTLESFKPAPPVKKEEKAVEETPKVEEPKTEEAAPVAVPAEAKPVEEERKKDETKSDERKRSASRKRTSFFNFGKKEEAKPVTTPAEEVKEEAPVTEEVKPVVETPKTEEAKTEEAPKEEAPAAEEKPAEEAKPLESPKEKPVPSKRNSFFDIFNKKEKKTPELKPTEPVDAPKEVEASETAPVIPPVEATTPLAVAVDAAAPAETPAEETKVEAPKEETKKDVKEKRKSSLPFAFGKRDKSPAPAEGEEKSSLGPFSKLRATIKGKTSAPKAEEKPVEETKEEPIKEEGEVKTEAPAEETKTEAPKEETVKPAEPAVEAKPEQVTTATPAVTAAA